MLIHTKMLLAALMLSGGVLVPNGGDVGQWWPQLLTGMSGLSSLAWLILAYLLTSVQECLLNSSS